VLGDELGVLAKAIAGALDLVTTAWCRSWLRNAVATTESPKISPHSAKPQLKASFEGTDHGAPLVAGSAQLDPKLGSADCPGFGLSVASAAEVDRARATRRLYWLQVVYEPLN
jgi:hypothetical protein